MKQQLIIFNGGLQTKLAPHLVEPNFAVECQNVDLDKGSIYPLKEWVENTNDASDITGKYITWFKNKVIANTDEADERSYAVFGGRLYWTNGGYSEYGLMRWNGTAAVNAEPPTVTSFGTLTLTPSGTNGALNEAYVYCYTVVDTDGIESIPSPVYLVTPVNQNVSITIGTDTVTEDVEYRRIYRTGGTNPTFNLIAELPDGTLTFTDNIKDLDVSRMELATFSNYAPPPDLKNLVENGGTMWGSVGDRIYFSRNGQPEFWSPLDFVNLNDTCTGIGRFQNMILAFTEADAYVITGFNRDNVSIMKLPYNEGCLKHHTIANVNQLLLWTSKNGICVFDGNAVTIATRNILSWFSDSVVGSQTFDSLSGTFDSNIGYVVTKAIGVRGKYYAVYQDGIGVLDLNNGAIASTISLAGAVSLYLDENENAIVGVTEDYVGYWFGLDVDNMIAKWKTPKLQPEGFAKIKQFRKVELDAVPLNVKVYIDDKQVISVDKKRMFYLPSGCWGHTIQFYIETDVEIKSLKYGYGILNG